MWGFIKRYAPEAAPDTHPDLDQAAGFAVRYYQDYVKPSKTFRAPEPQEAQALADLSARLRAHDGPADDETLQSIVVHGNGRAHFSGAVTHAVQVRWCLWRPPSRSGPMTEWRVVERGPGLPETSQLPIP